MSGEAGFSFFGIRLLALHALNNEDHRRILPVVVNSCCDPASEPRISRAVASALEVPLASSNI